MIDMEDIKKRLLKVVEDMQNTGDNALQQLRIYYKVDEIYPLSDSQFAQVDCRETKCKYHEGMGVCGNLSPALEVDGKYSYCKSKEVLD